MSITSEVKSFSESIMLIEPFGKTETKIIEDEYIESGNVSFQLLISIFSTDGKLRCEIFEIFEIFLNQNFYHQNSNIRENIQLL